MKFIYIYSSLYFEFIIEPYVGMGIRSIASNCTNTPRPSEYVQSRNIILGSINGPPTNFHNHNGLQHSI